MMMKPRAIMLLAAACAVPVASCGPTPEQQERRDEVDIGKVEAAQKLRPPVQRIAPEPIGFVDVQAASLSGAGCAYIAGGGEGLDPVLYIDSARGFLKLGGEMVQFAADAGSAEFPYGARERYTGRSMELVLSRAPGEGSPSGEEAMRWPGTLTVRDQFGRIAYDNVGTLECGA